MKKMLIAIAVACLLPWNYANANDAPLILEVRNLQPLEESALVMEHEKIEYIVSESGEVSGSVEFTFVNPTDKAIEQQTIFPIESNYGSGLQFEEGKEYAKDIKVRVNGKSVVTTVGNGQYLKRSEDGSLNVSQPASGVLFGFSVPAKGKTQVLTTFKPYMWSYGGEFLNFGYYYGSGVGWSGNIGKAEVSVKYPYDIQNGWIELYIGDLVKSDFSGRTANLEVTGFEPRTGYEWLRFIILPPKMGSAIIKAQHEAERSKSADAYARLAEAYKNTVDRRESGYTPSLKRPEFARIGYWEAIEKMLEKKFGVKSPSFSFLQTAERSQDEYLASSGVTDAYELLKLYADGWQPRYSANRYDQLIDLEKYESLLDEVRSLKITEDYWWMRGWSLSAYEVANQLEYNDASWRANRTDLFPAESSAVEATGIEPTTTETGSVTELPQPASSIKAPTEISIEQTPTAQGETQKPAIFWFLLGLAGGLFSWSAWLWLKRREN